MAPVDALEVCPGGASGGRAGYRRDERFDSRPRHRGASRAGTPARGRGRDLPLSAGPASASHGPLWTLRLSYAPSPRHHRPGCRLGHWPVDLPGRASPEYGDVRGHAGKCKRWGIPGSFAGLRLSDLDPASAGRARSRRVRQRARGENASASPGARRIGHDALFRESSGSGRAQCRFARADADHVAHRGGFG